MHDIVGPVEKARKARLAKEPKEQHKTPNHLQPAEAARSRLALRSAIAFAVVLDLALALRCCWSFT
jgi:hypothetical protein